MASEKKELIILSLKWTKSLYRTNFLEKGDARPALMTQTAPSGQTDRARLKLYRPVDKMGMDVSNYMKKNRNKANI